MGALLFYEDGRVQHGGVILNVGGDPPVAGHLYAGARTTMRGLFRAPAAGAGRLGGDGSVPGHTQGGVCKVGGFDEEPGRGLQRRGPVPEDPRGGHRVIWTPRAAMIPGIGVPRCGRTRRPPGGSARRSPTCAPAGARCCQRPLLRTELRPGPCGLPPGLPAPAGEALAEARALVLRVHLAEGGQREDADHCQGDGRQHGHEHLAGTEPDGPQLAGDQRAGDGAPGGRRRWRSPPPPPGPGAGSRPARARRGHRARPPPGSRWPRPRR